MPSSANIEDPFSLVCSTCRIGPFSLSGFNQALYSGLNRDAPGYTYTTTWSSILRSIAEESCAWCRIILRTRDELPVDRYPPAGEDSVEVRFQVTRELGWNGCLRLYLNGASEGVIYRAYEEKDRDSLHEKSYVDYVKALECIKQCSAHEHCPPIAETFLPTRVIDCSDPSKPHLIETHRQLKGHYCTLSYVWGGEQHQKTTTSNINTYTREGITVPLPQTIADAIFVTHKLGMRYLWVDALCIIQDSSKDKDNELGIMAHIYQDSYLTISALSAFRADQGFLPDERAPDVLPFLSADDSDTQPATQMLLRYIIPRPNPLLGHKHNTVVLHTPLDNRAWCLQESRLSPRRLVFQPPNVFYKCRSFSEQDVSVPPDAPFLRRFKPRGPLPTKDHILFPIAKAPGAGDGGGGGTSVTLSASRGEAPITAADLQREWRTILVDYTNRGLTSPADKLVALGSIAEVFQSLLHSPYIAGIWRLHLLDDLLWQVWPPMGPTERPHPRPAAYRGPSWSWAAVDGQLHFPAPGDPPTEAASYEAEVVEYEATPKVHGYPFGEVTDGRLVLRAKFRTLIRDGGACTFLEHRGETTGSVFARGATGWSWTMPAGNCFRPPSSASTNTSSGDSSQKKEIGAVFDSLEGTEQDQPRKFYVVILRAGRNWKNQGDWMSGLLLVRDEGEVERYRRVAKLSLNDLQEWPDWFDNAPLQTVVLV